MKGQLERSAVGVVAVAVSLAGCGEGGPPVTEVGEVRFQVATEWPKPLPADWILGQVSGITVDGRDHVWIVHRPGSLTPQEAGAVQDPPISLCCTPAPAVVEFDPEGNVVRAWGGPGVGYDWPAVEHGIHADHEGNIWVGGNGPDDNILLKFTADGDFLLQIGQPGVSDGSNDPNTLGRPAGMVVDPAGNELYVADGYANRRVVVFDAETGEYRRHWGAYGARPEDVQLPPYDPAEEPARQFRTPVHGIAVSRDGRVYVADRNNNRIQEFETDGTFLREAFIEPGTLSMGSVWDVSLSRDPSHRRIIVADGTNNVLWIVERETLEVVGRIGRTGRFPGQFMWVHNVDTDSRGNIFASEVETGKRIQKFEPATR